MLVKEMVRSYVRGVRRAVEFMATDFSSRFIEKSEIRKAAEEIAGLPEDKRDEAIEEWVISVPEEQRPLVSRWLKRLITWEAKDVYV